MKESIVRAAAEFARQHVAGADASHDFAHIERVVAVAKSLAAEEGLPESSLEVVELAAYLHDVGDFKYSNSETAGIEACLEFFDQHGYDAAKRDLVLRIVQNISFRTELGGACDVFPELAVVQDADRLDAIGAIGIARCFSFGGMKKRPFYDDAVQARQALTKEDYMHGKGAPSLNHFDEKLLKLKGLMKTAAGRRLAEGRHQFMVDFLAQFNNERTGAA